MKQLLLMLVVVWMLYLPGARVQKIQLKEDVMGGFWSAPWQNGMSFRDMKDHKIFVSGNFYIRQE